MLLILLQVVCCVLFVDLLTGLVHWLEDSYGNEDTPLIGKLITQENNRHHQQPAYMTRFGYWYTSGMLIGVAGVIGLGAWALGLFSWQLGLVLALGANANQIHKWTHRSRRANGRVVSWLQDIRLFQSQADHAKHHRGDQRGHYCVVTPHLNALFERFKVWERAERGIERAFGVARREPSKGRLPEAPRRAA